MTYNEKTWRTLITSDLSPAEADVNVLGVPFDKGCSNREGARLGPQKIREASTQDTPFTEAGSSLTLKWHDAGDITFQAIWEAQSEYFKRVQKQAIEFFQYRLSRCPGACFPLFLGGDHSITIPVIRALDQVLPVTQKTAVVHLDAHLDLVNEIDGNPLSHGSTHLRILELERFQPADFFFLGIRCYEQEELNFTADKQMKFSTAKDIYTHGVHAIGKQLLAHLNDYHYVYLTLDIDVLDPAYAPGTGTPVPGGLSTREALTLLEWIAQTQAQLIGMDLVEVSPPWDQSEITALAAQRLIFEMLGYLKVK